MDRAKAGRRAGTIAVVGALLLLWEVAATYGKWLNPVLFPRLEEIFAALWNHLPDLFRGFLSSMSLFVPGYGLAVAAGIAGGLYFGLHPRIRRVLMPLFHLLSPIPPTMYIPYAIALLPTFGTASVFLIFIGAFWPVFMNTVHGVLFIEKSVLDNARVLGLRGRLLIFKVILPAASPYIFEGAGVALAFSFILLTVAEMFGAKSGMGYFIQYYADFSDYKNVLAGMLFNGLVILGITALFEKVKHRLLFWTRLRP
ncbi:MAG: ABC transporter permease [Kyrpidia sp.]|nr:ABC transporter permease [Kyrpidia sp.]